jgi:hypothetical protein
LIMRPFTLATLMRAIKVAEARFLEGRANGMNPETTYKSDYMEQMQREVRGVLAETVIGRRFDKHFFPSVNKFHKVADVGDDIEVRSTEHPDGALIVRDNDDPRRRYVLVHVDLNERKNQPQMGFEIRGWVWGHEAMTEKWWQDRKGRPSWWYYGDLKPIDELTLHAPQSGDGAAP